jgi:hypothetical protein
MNACRRRLIASTALLATFLIHGSADSRADVPVQLTRVGNPIWRLVDFHTFSAAAHPDEEFFAAVDLVLGPDAPRDPPYDNIISDNMAAAGILDTTIFLPSDIDGQPRGVYHAYSVVPDPGTIGSSPDFASGPIIPNRLYPLTYDHDLLRNGVVVDPAVFDGQIPPFAGVDGDSHELFLLEEDASFFPPGTELPGNWEYRTVFRDAEGNGWDIVAPFQVVPEPSTLALTLTSLLLAGIGGLRFVRARA